LPGIVVLRLCNLRAMIPYNWATSVYFKPELQYSKIKQPPGPGHHYPETQKGRNEWLQKILFREHIREYVYVFFEIVWDVEKWIIVRTYICTVGTCAYIHYYQFVHKTRVRTHTYHALVLILIGERAKNKETFLIKYNALCPIVSTFFSVQEPCSFHWSYPFCRFNWLNLVLLDLYWVQEHILIRFVPSEIQHYI